jgi:hypothetical protein
MGFNFLNAAFSVILLVIEMCPLALHGQASESHSAKAKEAVEPNEHPLFYPDAEFVGSRCHSCSSHLAQTQLRSTLLRG